MSTLVEGRERRRSDCDYYTSRYSCNYESSCVWKCNDYGCYCNQTAISKMITTIIGIGVVGFCCVLCGYFVYQRRRRQRRTFGNGQAIAIAAKQGNYPSPVPPAVSQPYVTPQNQHGMYNPTAANTYAAQPASYHTPTQGSYNAPSNAPPPGTSYNHGGAAYQPPPPAYEPEGRT